MRRLSLLLLLPLVVACSHAASVPPIRGSGPGGAHLGHDIGSGQIQHVVVIVQENRSFDNLFWSFPGADSTTNCALDHLGVCVSMVQQPLYQPTDIPHTTSACQGDYDNGKMDGFDLEFGGKKSRSSFEPYQFTLQSDVQAYWQLASQYVLADRMFQSNCGPSFPAHQMIIAGTMGYNNNPSVPWGCDNTRFRQASICYDYQTMADLLDTSGLSWRYYSPGGNGGSNPSANLSIWQAYQAIRHIRFGSDWSNGDIVDVGQFMNDVRSGALPNVSWIVPTGANSDHPADGTDAGPAWVASLVDAIGQSSSWNSTAIFITWDDWGGWYDHVAPQQIDQNGLGFRVPLIVVSPYAKAGYVSHVQHEFGSILHFTEAQYGLPSLGTRDHIADDLSDCFDFTQPPRPFQAIAHAQYARHDASPPDND